jgi:hypothetical protein
MSTLARYGVAGTDVGPRAIKVPVRDPNVGSERYATG